MQCVTIISYALVESDLQLTINLAIPQNKQNLSSLFIFVFYLDMPLKTFETCIEKRLRKCGIKSQTVFNPAFLQ